MGGGPERPAAGSRDHQENLHGLVDMGSNGIRFSITDLSPPTSRVLPTVYQYRSDISLYDAQYDDDGNRVPIPKDTIDLVVAALLHFRVYCADFGVPRGNIKVLATEATRTALNSEEFRETIARTTGLIVEMLPKVTEGEVGAWGIASGFSGMGGLAMDLGGGSTQITWMIMDKGKVTTSAKGAVSFPYGAAALSRRLAQIDKGKSKEEARRGRDKLRQEMKANFEQAYEELEVPPELVTTAEKKGGFPLYLSGGGFRGWGYILLYLNQIHGHHYPISIVNGFTAHKDAFQDTETIKEVAKTAHEIFRVSDRRRDQVPAVAFLISVLADTIPHGIREAHFCQGGVREGYFFRQLAPSVRAQDPLEVASRRYARPLAPFLDALLRSALPAPSSTTDQRVPTSLSPHIVRALANMFYYHAAMSKESASAAALQSTCTGILASVHGLSHPDRALLALLLEARYEGELPPAQLQLKAQLRTLLPSTAAAWWAEYLGRVALVLSRVYPAGHAEGEVDKPGLALRAEFVNDLGRKGKKEGVRLWCELDMKGRDPADPMMVKETVESHVKRIEKMGKKKNWIGGRDGWGMKVEVLVKVV